jgi:hypothetical protein
MKKNHSEFEYRFKELTHALDQQFPKLDLIFNHNCASQQARILNGEDHSIVAEVDLSRSVQENIYDAIFSVKEVLSLYDC